MIIVRDPEKIEKYHYSGCIAWSSGHYKEIEYNCRKE